MKETVAAHGNLSIRSSLVQSGGAMDAGFADEGVHEPFPGENVNRQILEKAKARKAMLIREAGFNVGFGGAKFD